LIEALGLAQHTKAAIYRAGPARFFPSAADDKILKDESNSAFSIATKPVTAAEDFSGPKNPAFREKNSKNHTLEQIPGAHQAEKR